MSLKQVTIPQEQFKLIKPMLYLSRFFCLCPVKWRKLNSDYLVATSKLYMALSCTAIFSLVSLAIWGLCEVYKIDVVYRIRFKGPTERYVTLCDTSVVLLSGIFGTILTSTKIHQFHRYFTCINQIDANLGGYVEKKTGKYLFVTLAAMSCTGMLLCLDLSLWLKISAKSDNILQVLVNFFPYYTCYIFTMVMEVNYWHFVHLLKTRIVSLNRYLAEFNDAKPERARISRKSINAVVDTFTVGKNCFSQPQLPRKPIQLANIREIVTAYERIVEATQIVNTFYGMTILVVVIGIVLHLLVTPYALYSIISTTENRSFIISQSMWMIGHVLRLIFIVEPCHGCLCEAKSTLELACKILCTDLNSQLRKEVEMFVVLLANCKIEFTVYGLTNIDRSLLTAITGAVTTYLVILFQFRN